jgi:hypothetical protein
MAALATLWIRRLWLSKQGHCSRPRASLPAIGQKQGVPAHHLESVVPKTPNALVASWQALFNKLEPATVEEEVAYF